MTGPLDLLVSLCKETNASVQFSSGLELVSSDLPIPSRITVTFLPPTVKKFKDNPVIAKWNDKI